MISIPQNDGFGKDIPPCRSHVIAWFIQMGLTEKSALGFYSYYEQNCWRSKSGKTLKNWKMTAWYWIWYKS